MQSCTPALMKLTCQPVNQLTNNQPVSHPSNQTLDLSEHDMCHTIHVTTELHRTPSRPGTNRSTPRHSNTSLYHTTLPRNALAPTQPAGLRLSMFVSGAIRNTNTSQSSKQMTRQSTNQPINKSASYHSINLTTITNQTTSQRNKQPVSQPSNQPANQTVIQVIN